MNMRVRIFLQDFDKSCIIYKLDVGDPISVMRSATMWINSSGPLKGSLCHTTINVHPVGFVVPDLDSAFKCCTGSFSKRLARIGVNEIGLKSFMGLLTGVNFGAGITSASFQQDGTLPSLSELLKMAHM